MNDYKCSFVNALIKRDFTCQMAQNVTRRTGPDIACNSECASTACKKLLDSFKSNGLQAFGMEDNLLKTPHSVYAKIQFGGLQGLARDIKNTSEVECVDNIYQLVKQAIERYNCVENIPSKNYIEHMLRFKIKRKK